MPTERLAMRHVRDVIRLKSAGMAIRSPLCPFPFMEDLDGAGGEPNSPSSRRPQD
jgi:hypothetical protein